MTVDLTFLEELGPEQAHIVVATSDEVPAARELSADVFEELGFRPAITVEPMLATKGEPRVVSRDRVSGTRVRARARERAKTAKAED